MPDGCTVKSTAPSVAGAGTTALDGAAASGWPGAPSAPLMVAPFKKSTEGHESTAQLTRAARSFAKIADAEPHGRARGFGTGRWRPPIRTLARARKLHSPPCERRTGIGGVKTEE